ncbi:MAG TPA: two-component regulator propeller domain-containing protein [Polyangia bacterium]|nr:two-component regulator propeller domain-containing protein [Polyangia bacterium]
MLSALTTLVLQASLTCALAADRPAPPLGRYQFESFGSEQGLSNLAELDFAEDSDGYLWTGSQEGLFRFDGTRFVHFGREAGLPSTYVSALAARRDGRLWVGTWEGLARRDGARFTVVDGVPHAIVNGLVLDSQSRLWVASRVGLYAEDAPDHFALAAHWPGGEASALTVDNDGRILAAVGSRLLRRGRDGAWRTLADESVIGDHETITSIAVDGSRRIWMRSRARIWVRQDDSGDESGGFVERSCLLPSRNSEGSMSVDHQGRLLVPTTRGILRVGATTTEIIDRAHGLPTDEAMAAFVDSSGSLWVGSVGVHRLAGRDLMTGYGSADGLTNEVIWQIARTPDGTLWLGSDDGLLRATPRGWQLVPGTEGHSFRGLGWHDGGLFGGGSPSELLRIDPTTLRITRAGGAYGVSGVIMGLAFDGASDMWLATRGAGLLHGTRAAHEDAGALPHFTSYVLPGGSATEHIDWVTADAQGRIWAAGERGLGLVTPAGARRFTRADGLRGDYVSGVLARRSGDICVEYFEPIGIDCFRLGARDLEDIRHFDSQTGLPSDKAYSLGEDDNDRLYVGSASGLGILGTDGRVDVFQRGDGLPGDDLDAMAVFADKDGTMWFGSSTGLGRFDSAHYHGPPAPPKSVISSVRVGERLFGAPPADLRVGRSDSIEFRYSTLGFLDSHQVSRQMRLAGADDRWSATDAKEARYQALPPGRYQLGVRSRFGSGAWGQPAFAAFVVAPAWWQNWWLRALFALVVAALVFVGVRWRLARLGRRNVELERIVAGRTRELSQAQLRVAESEKFTALGRLLAQLSHELSNPINVIANNLPPMRDYLNELERTLLEARELATPYARTKLDALWGERDLDFVLTDFQQALNVVEMAAARVQAVHSDLRAFMRGGQLQKAMGDLRVPLHETVQMLRRTLPPGVTIHERLPELPPLAFHAGQLSQVFLNLLSNSLDALGGHGMIVIEGSVDETFVEVVITDNGPGVPATVRERIFEPFFTTKDVGKGTGLGLAVCRQIVVNNHGGTFELDSTWTTGARFIMRLPLAAVAGIAEVVNV